MPTYNRAKFIANTIESVLNQSYRPIELIVVDDGSTDCTETLISDITKKHQYDTDLKFRYIKQPKSGAQAARNTGFHVSKGEFIQFLDSDDLLSPHKIRNQVNALINRSDFDVAYGGWKIFCGFRRPVKYGPLHQKEPANSNEDMLRGYLASEWYCPLHTYLFRQNVINAVGLFDEKLLRRQDTDYLIRTLINGHLFLYVDDSVVLYRRHIGKHIGSANNYQTHFSSALRVIENAHAILDKKEIVDQYNREIISYLLQLADEAIYMDFSRGSELARERLNRWFLYNPGKYSSPSIKKKYIYKRLVWAAKHFIGDCALDWINKGIFKKDIRTL